MQRVDLLRGAQSVPRIGIRGRSAGGKRARRDHRLRAQHRRCGQGYQPKLNIDKRREKAFARLAGLAVDHLLRSIDIETEPLQEAISDRTVSKLQPRLIAILGDQNEVRSAHARDLLHYLGRQQNLVTVEELALVFIERRRGNGQQADLHTRAASLQCLVGCQQCILVQRAVIQGKSFAQILVNAASGGHPARNDIDLVSDQRHNGAAARTAVGRKARRSRRRPRQIIRPGFLRPQRSDTPVVMSLRKYSIGPCAIWGWPWGLTAAALPATLRSFQPHTRRRPWHRLTLPTCRLPCRLLVAFASFSTARIRSTAPRLAGRPSVHPSPSALLRFEAAPLFAACVAGGLVRVRAIRSCPTDSDRFHPCWIPSIFRRFGASGCRCR